MNGVVIELTEAELDRLDIREIRYDRVDVTGSVKGEDLPSGSSPTRRSRSTSRQRPRRTP